MAIERSPIGRLPKLTLSSLFVAGGVVLLLLSLVKRITLVHAPLSYYDEGVLLTDSDLVYRGQITFRDFYSIYPPAIYYLIAGVFWLFGVSALGPRVLGVAIACCLVALAARHAGALSGRRFSWLTGGLVAVWLIPLMNVPYTWLVALSLALAALECLVSEDRRKVLAGGVLLGILSAFRHDLFVYTGGLWFAVVVLAFFLRRRRSDFATLAPSVLLQALVVAGSVALVLWTAIVVSGTPHNVWRDLVYNVSKYIMQSRTLPFPDLLALRATPGLGLPLPVVLSRYFEAGVVVCFAGPAAGAWLVFRSFRARAEARLVLRNLLLLALCLAVIPQMSARTDGDHVLLSVTPSLIVLGAVAERFASAPQPRLRFAAAGLAALLVLPLPHAFLSVPRTRETAALGIPREGGVPQPDPSVVRARKEVQSWVERYSKPGDPIFVGTLTHERAHLVEMDLYFLFDRTGATRFMQFDPNLTTRPDVQTEMIDDLKKRRGRLAILSSRPEFEEQKNVIPGSHLLDEFLAENFREVAVIPPYRVLVANDVLHARGE